MPRRLTALTAIVGLVVALGACGDDGSTSPTDVSTDGSSSSLVAPTGFATVAGVVTAADGETCEVCLWAARTEEERERGLMGVTDLSGADGMVFTWDAPTVVNFWMRDTPSPLSIAFFAADGSFVSSADMTPCLDGPPDECTRYAAGGPYMYAVEVAEGALGDLLIGEGSHLELLATPCPDGPD